MSHITGGGLIENLEFYGAWEWKKTVGKRPRSSISCSRLAKSAITKWLAYLTWVWACALWSAKRSPPFRRAGAADADPWVIGKLNNSGELSWLKMPAPPKTLWCWPVAACSSTGQSPDSPIFLRYLQSTRCWVPIEGGRPRHCYSNAGSSSFDDRESFDSALAMHRRNRRQWIF